MMKRALFVLVAICALTIPSSAQILKGTWMLNPQISGFNLGSTHTKETGKSTFDLGLRVDASNFIAKNLAVLLGFGGDFSWNKEFTNNSFDLRAGMRYYTLTTLFIGVNMGYTHDWNKAKDAVSFKRGDYLYIGAELGYAIFVNQNVSIDPALYWKHSFTDRYDQYGIKVGFSVYF